MELFNNKELELLRKAGVNVENKQDFTNDDKKYIFRQVSEFIMSHSSKNGDIGRLQNEYDSIFYTLLSSLNEFILSHAIPPYNNKYTNYLLFFQ